MAEVSDPAALLPPATCGTVCAVAGQAQRDLQDCADRFRGLFADGAFDAAFFSTVCLANTYCAPWLTARQLRMANRSSLWAFGLDRLIDHVATARSEVDALVRRSLIVADGLPFPADDPLSAFLAEIRDDLADAPSYPRLGAMWREELAFMLAAMTREWQWKAGRRAGAPDPRVADYLDNSGNFGFSFVFVSHLIATAEQISKRDALALRAASRHAQRAMRLINDLGTYDRDVAWGDLNVLMLGETPDTVTALIAPMVERSRGVIAPLKAAQPRLAGYVERQLDFNLGFYGVTDYVGRTSPALTG